ncbi:Crp/Fnr family transcriptional regulator [Polaribacter sp. R77954]|uniref:Crp/Fnr family transcriptional regulator n=1 Tax=Polaribacter sp. R77954 TaxID=3093870 RepID=UPI0037C61987
MAQNEQERRCENCIVRQFNNLRALSKEELKLVSDAKVTKRIKKGDTIFEEGEKLNGIFCVRDGVSKVSKLSSNGKDQIVKLVTKGEVLGQSSIISEETSKLSATAINNMEVCFIPKEKIATPLQANPKFTMSVLKTMVKDLNESNENILRLSQKNVKQRIAQALLYIKNNYGEDEEGFLNLNLSREDLANVVGTAVETCIRNISMFKKQGYIKQSKKKIAIVDAKRLERFIEDFDY